MQCVHMGVTPPVAESLQTAADDLAGADWSGESHAPTQLCLWGRVFSLRASQVSLTLDMVYMVRVLLLVRSIGTNFHPNSKAAFPFRDV